MFRNEKRLQGAGFTAAVMILSLLLYTAFHVDGIYIIVGDGLIYGTGFYFFFQKILRNYDQECKELSLFLRKAQHELLPLEAGAQQEGEFGVLKSEIYKLLTKLHYQAELLNKEKTYLADTISDISHQLKTPMTSMNVMIDLLKDSELPKERRLEFIRTLHSQMERMEWLISSMLTMSRLDAGTLKLKKDRVQTNQMLKKAMEHLLIPMELHGLSLVRTGDDDTYYMGDLDWSSEAVSNILKNCIEYTPDYGTITIETKQNPVYTEIQITDEGPGMNEKDLSHIFDRFYKGTHACVNSVGIGLFLSKKLIRLQNGTVEASSVYGKASTFTIKFYHQNM